MTEAAPNPRWFHPTPDRLLIGLLVVEGLLWLSERFQWFAWHKGYAVLTTVATVGVAMILLLLWFVLALVFRWRFQFTIRSLLVLTVAIAMPCSWMAVKMKAARKQREVVKEIEKSGALVVYDYGFYLPLHAKPQDCVWLRNALGDDFFNDAAIIAFLSAAQIGQVNKLPQLRWLGVNAVTDAELAQIAGLTQLEALDLSGTRITDAGLAQISGMNQLQSLRLCYTQITDAGLANLAGLTQLNHLSLDCAKITDTGLARLRNLPQLRELNLGGTQVTDEGVKKLQQALPNCKIMR